MRNTKELIGFSKKIATYLQTPTTFWKPDTARYMNLSPEQKTSGNQKLRQLLDTMNENKFLFRGTMGNIELDSAIATQELGHDFYKSGKSIDLDLIAHVRENHSALFLSASECPYAAKPYASCIATWPCRGFILVLGRPKVTTVPHKLLHLHTAALTEYDTRMVIPPKNN